MNNPNPESLPENEVPVAPQPVDPRRRLRELLSIAERDRSDEQWDEIIELEIQLAPGNRISGNDLPAQGQGQGRGASGQGKAGAGGGAQQKKHRPRTNNNNNRRPRQPKPQSGGGTPTA